MVGDTVTTETAIFLLALLDAQQLNVGAADFEEAVHQVLTARHELIAVIEPTT